MAYHAFIQAARFHHGYIKTREIPVYSFSPILPLKGHLPASVILASLINCKIFTRIDDTTLKLSNEAFPHDSFNRFKAIDLAKTQVISSLGQWAAKTNLISYYAGKGLGQVPEFGKFQWSFTGPSYLSALKKNGPGKEIPGFLMADVVIGRKCSLLDINFFLRKLAILKSQKSSAVIFPMLICENLTEDALETLRSKGIMIGFIREIFGQAYADTLRELIGVISSATKVIMENPDKFFELASQLHKLEGTFGNIKGDMFEFAVGYYYSISNMPIKIGKVITDRVTGDSREIDVLVNTNNEIRIVECKGYKNVLDDEYVKKWLTETISIVRSWLLSQDEYEHKQIIFELWSTGGFSDKALQLLQKAKSEVKDTKYIVEYFDRFAIKGKFKQTKNEKLKSVLRLYY